MEKILPPHRPHYPPVERMAILELRAARGWSLAQTARAFQLEPETVSSWMKRIDQKGESGLIRLPEPINRFPSFVSYMVRRLKTLCPLMGKKWMAQVLARAGLRFNEYCPHQSLGGCTPAEWHDGKVVPFPCYETRGKNAVRIELVVNYFEDRRHLPQVELQKAA